MQKKILILSEFGSGHTKAAEALAQSIAYLEPSIHTQIVEIGKMLHPTRTSFFFRVYTVYPFLWKKIYESKQNQPISQWLQFTIYQLFHRNIEQILDKIQPDLIICTHPFNSSSIARLKKMGYPVRLCTVITDFHTHGIWVQPEVDLYLVMEGVRSNIDLYRIQRFAKVYLAAQRTLSASTYRDFGLCRHD
ncbi:monogalactosyldiacylglycerol synthase-like protein [Paenibacillus larvae subsp. larvae DSM 25430]|uniref:Monogalactosyldiacylglycerol synthase-like protein n=2 Tax=Paenibacillus larvae subsp. larvae TaxID=147375 RepID=V9W7I1_9BACL|nr:monogalactosyldiacylglycerol synthase-like protein [Paenibacillus larvae]AHD05660.1 monogalactosyldiacylglycerol synthase-like protein [Paenibacillus larvae subsp. larvae DSM 25430]AVG12206.1 monogalactosyldiacylglycerol synthase-like protein [Paenibacillus larvae subsp. larvae DSM 25430]MDR5570102.1 hypothetical protein [Paenibacillus larvae]MDR5595954.1 hypothetical protein [Paenibacillus larvae]QHZ51817.1 monogalactosyldiacylglycerol synthase-like protein [Paenibacillus larvae subsp. lar